jgi:hypothetical protein
VSAAAVVLASVVVFVGLALPFLAQPIDSWEWLNRCAAEGIVAWGLPAVDYPLGPDAGSPGPAPIAPPPAAPNLLLIHPPSSAYLSALALRLLGDGDWQARVPGLLSVVLTAALLALLVQRHGGAPVSRAQPLTGGPSSAWAPGLAVVLYLVHPATLHGALYLSFSEGTLLPLTWLGFLLAWFETRGRSWLVRVLALGIGLALALWAKITTSLALPAAAALIGLLTEGPGAALALGVGVSLVGAALFLGSWWLYLTYLSTLTGLDAGTFWLTPFTYLAGEAQVFSLSGLVLNVARCVLYLGPFLVLAAALAIARRALEGLGRGQVAPGAIVPLLVVGVSGVYLLVPGGTGSFPKYHLVILPLLAWLAAEELGRIPVPRGALGMARGAGQVRSRLLTLRPAPAIGLLALGVAHYALLVGDPLRLLNHDLRVAQLMGGLGPVLVALGLAIALGLLFPLVLLAVVRRWRPALLATIVASHLALVLVQARAGYFTKHLYGTPAADFTQTVALLREATPPGGELVALPEFGYAARRPILRGLLRRAWSEPDALAALVRERQPAALVYGLPTHTVGQVRDLNMHTELRAALIEGGYRRRDVGEFAVWLPRR